MKKSLSFIFSLVSLGLFLVTLALPTWVQGAEATVAPPVAQQLVREGDFAVKLVFALGVGVTQDEVEAETRLGELGIVPRNGWIADYPVTPDIIGELRDAVAAAADEKKFTFGRDEALQRFEGVARDFNLAIRPYEKGAPTAEAPAPVTEINNYYTSEGPPVVTYYAPPPEWYYLYGWVPYPFWYGSFWFPGFYILYDFHRPHFVHNRAVFISNHFNDVRRHRVYRVDPVTRFNGRTFGGIGAPHRRDFIGTGVDRSERRIFNAPRNVTPPGMRPTPGMRTFVPSRGGERSFVPTQRDSGRSERSVVAPSRSGSQAPRAMGITQSRGGGSVSSGRGNSGSGRGGSRR